MSASSLPLRWLRSLEWRRGFFAWARTDGVTWVYIFKLRDGRITSYEQFNDARMTAAFR